MPYKRFYSNTLLQENEEVHLQDEELHHLKVCRLQIGESVEIINGKNVLAQARLIEFSPKKATLVIEHRTVKKPPQQIILAQGLARMNHLEWIIEKGTELGVTSFWLFAGMLSEKNKLSDNQTTRLKHLMLAAVKQCGRLDLPLLEYHRPLKEWARPQVTLLFGDLSESAPLLSKQAFSALKPPIILFIGPEAGLDLKEASFLKDSLGAQGVRLHSHILRTETAAIAGLVLIQAILNS
jgi:16S rRNA (uracil1498-N3)-methyltransferase